MKTLKFIKTGALATAILLAGAATQSSAQILAGPPPDMSGSTNPSACGNSDGSVSVNVYYASVLNNKVTVPHYYEFHYSDGLVTSQNLPLASTIGGVTDTRTGLPNGFYGVTVYGYESSSKLVLIITWGVGTPQGGGTVTLSSTDDGLIVTGSSTNACGGSNGTASVVASGGSTPYTYSWSPSGGANATATGLSAGSYTCTVSDGFPCTSYAIVNVGGSAVAVGVAVTGSTPDKCEQGVGTATAVASGGVSPVVFTWAGTNGFAPGFVTKGDTNIANSMLGGINYSVLVTDAAGCTASASLQMTNTNGTISVSATTNVAIHCNGSTGSAIASESGAAAAGNVFWEWYDETTNNGPFQTTIGGASNTTTAANPLSANKEYLVIAYDELVACGSYANITLAQPTAFTASLGTVNQQTAVDACDGNATATGSGGTAPYRYSWNTAPSQSTATASGLCDGTYSVNVKDHFGCGVATFTVSIDDGDGAALATNNPPKSHVSVYPLPAKNSLTVTVSGDDFTPAQVEALDMMGRVLYKQATDASKEFTIPVTSLSSGVYLLRVTSVKGDVKVTRIIVNRQ